MHVASPDAHSGGVSGLVRDFVLIAFSRRVKKELTPKINFGVFEGSNFENSNSWKVELSKAARTSSKPMVRPERLSMAELLGPTQVMMGFFG